MRTLLFAVTALALFASIGLAEPAKGDKKKGGGYVGTIKKVDAAAGTITVTHKKDGMDKEFKISDDTKIIIHDGDDKKELAGKEGLKNEKIKEGAMVRIMEEGGMVKEIMVGGGKKKK